MTIRSATSVISQKPSQKVHSHGPDKWTRPGSTSSMFYAIEMSLVTSLLISKLDQMQRISDSDIVYLQNYIPPFIMNLLPFISEKSFMLAVISFIVHYLGYRNKTTRVILTELLCFVGWALFIPITALFVTEDALLLEFMISCFLFIIITFNLFAKRKIKHKKKPNTFYSAFSVASTPTSQCSSAYLNASRRSAFSNSRQSLNFSQASNKLNEDSFMDTSPALDDLPDLRSQNQRTFRKEQTPFTELSGRLDGLSLDLSSKPSTIKSVFKPIQQSTMLSSAALTPSKKTRNEAVFGSPHFNSNNKTSWSSATFTSPSRPSSVKSAFEPFNPPSMRRLEFDNVSQSTLPSKQQLLLPNRLRSIAGSTCSSSISTRRSSSNNGITFTKAIIGVLAAIGGVSLFGIIYQYVSSNLL